MGYWSLTLRVPNLRKVLWTSLFCSLLAGAYGILHDQISYTLSPEYFTYVKFRQFAWIGLQSHPHLFTAAIGFMATWWVGFAGGWFLERMGPSDKSNSDLARALTLVFAATLTIGVLGAFVGWLRSFAELGEWKVWQATLNSGQVRRLITVTYLHWASYIGGALGVIAVTFYYQHLSSRKL